VSDLYHWRTGTLSPDPDPKTHPYDYAAAYLTPEFSFDQLPRWRTGIGAHMLVHVNYGTGTPAEAAAWVRHADVANHDGVQDWEIGEEVYLNGGVSPALNVEPDAHADKSAAAYAKNVLAYVKGDEGGSPLDPSRSRGCTRSPNPETPCGTGIKPYCGSRAGLSTSQTSIGIRWRARPIPRIRSVLASVGQIPATMSAMQSLVTRNAGPAHTLRAVGNRRDELGGCRDAAADQSGQCAVSDQYQPHLVGAWCDRCRVGGRCTTVGGGTDTAGFGDLGLLFHRQLRERRQCMRTAGRTRPSPPYYGMQLLGTVAKCRR